MSTDKAWEEWGRRDPYFGVITCEKFRRTELTTDAKREFFESGRVHAQYVMQMINQHIDPHFRPRAILDFGCGVGRLVVPFARIAQEVVGLDVSSSMLLEAKRNCDELGVRNVRLLVSDDSLSALTGKYDLIHSFIVFQHIPSYRGGAIFRGLLSFLKDGGVGAMHFAYSKDIYATTNGVPPPPLRSVSINAEAPPSDADPEMQMNPYSMTEILFLMQKSGVYRFHAEFTDHGGELGIFLFFQKPATAQT
jgi:SAM-dependent methyltransferase